jgi:hypothetical protein
VANEQGPIDASGVPFDEDEDLFDFPIIEMTLDGLQERTPGADPRPRSSPSQPAPAAPLPAKLPPVVAPASSTVAPAPAVDETKPTAPIPAAQKPAVPGSAAQKPPPAVPAAQKPAGPIPAAQKPAATKASAAPAQVPIATLMAAPAAPPVREDVVAPPPRRSRMRGMRVAMLLLLGLNGLGFWFLWRTHSTFGAGLDGLRAELDDAALRLERARRDVERGVGAVPGGAGLETVDALERSAIEIAVNEIKNGEYGAARKRLSRLLVRAERMSSGLRAEIEPRAAYLIATSYHDEARARKAAKH